MNRLEDFKAIRKTINKDYMHVDIGTVDYFISEIERLRKVMDEVAYNISVMEYKEAEIILEQALKEK